MFEIKVLPLLCALGGLQRISSGRFLSPSAFWNLFSIRIERDLFLLMENIADKSR